MPGPGRASTRRCRPWLTAAAAVALAVLGGLVPLVGGAPPAQASPRWACEPNPTNGFTVLVREDAVLAGAEVEGTVGVGGTLQWLSTFDVRHTTGLTPPGYPLPTLTVDGEQRPVRVAAGALDLTGSSGTLQVGAAEPYPRGHLVTGTATWTSTTLQGEEVFLNGTGSAARVVTPDPPGPPAPDAVDAWAAEYVGPLDLTPFFGDPVWTALEADSDLTAELSGAQPGVTEVTLAGGPNEKTLTLTPGTVNVLSVTPAALAGVTAISFTGGVVPSSGTPLFIKLEGGTSFQIPRFNGANDTGTNNLFAPWVLWNYNDDGPLTLTGTDRMTGSLLAPRADVTLNNPSPFEGQIVAGSLVKPQGTGEIHHYSFGACGPDPLPDTGTFTIDKAALVVEGTFADEEVPAEFTVAWWVDGERQLPDLTIRADGTLVGPISVPAEAVVELGEVDPPPVLGGEWQPPTWTVTGGTPIDPEQEGAELAFVVGDETLVEAEVTNRLVGQGLFSLSKTVEDPLGIGGAPDTVTFRWWVDGVAQSPDLVVSSDGTVLGPVTVAPNSVVELLEVPPAAPPGGVWEAPTWTVTGGTTAEPQNGGFAFTVGQGSTVSAVAAVNVLDAAAAAETGGFAVTKVVAGATGQVPAGAVFTGTWVCDAAGSGGVSQGTWAVTAGATTVRDGFPVGTTCTVAEDAVQPGGTSTTSLSPAGGRVVVAAGDPAVVGAVTVTNTYTAPAPDGGEDVRDDAELAATGGVATAFGPLGVAALLAGGVLTVWHRRLRSGVHA